MKREAVASYVPVLECADMTSAWSFELAFIRAVIIAAREVTLSSNFLSGLLETDAIALH